MIRHARPDELDSVRAIFREYAALIGDHICFESFEREITSLPGEYSPILLAFADGHLAGCVALRRVSDGIAEMKRLFVRETFQGRGLGRLLTERVIEEARLRGCRLLRLDTLPTFQRAIRLYLSLGFREIPHYGDNPKAPSASK